MMTRGPVMTGRDPTIGDGSRGRRSAITTPPVPSAASRRDAGGGVAPNRSASVATPPRPSWRSCTASSSTRDRRAARLAAAEVRHRIEERLAALLAKEPDATPERIAQLKLAAHKSGREARHYADLTFSPPKSWSVLHTALEHAGRHEEAAAVWDAWEAGVHAGLEYLMDEAGYSRAGYHGAKVGGRTSGQWVDAHD